MNFTDLNVKTEIVQALEREGIVEPTTIQQKAIPLIQAGKDVIGMSRTGSGKTVTFGVPLIEKIVSGQGIQTLVMCPTRELAVQISNEMKKFGKNVKLNVATVFGGVALDPQIDAMARAEVLVSTPGRLLDHLGRRNVDLTKIKHVVLDEADKMVEMGFVEDIEEIISYTPDKKQMLLFGATICDEIDNIKRKHMADPVIAKAETHVGKDLLEQYYYDVQYNQKFSLLVHLIKEEKELDRVIIFCSSRSTVELLTKNLRVQGVKAEMIHGKMSQNKRLSVIDGFNKDKLKILVASAVAARGLDIKNVSHVFNYDLSQDPQEYIHRVGRTARAGESGKAITLLSDRDYGTFNQILNMYRELDVKCLDAGQFPRLMFDTQSFGRNLGNGSRGGRNFGPRRHNNNRRNYN
jgi:superfamily II DNA/RNA helicase